MQQSKVLSDFRILLAEDELLISRFLCRVLEQAGANVTPVRRVREVAELAQSGFDGALLDVSLEDGDVFPAAEILARNGVPVVFHSGHDQPAKRMKEGQIAASLDKPALADEIIRTLVRCIASKKAAA